MVSDKSAENNGNGHVAGESLFKKSRRVYIEGSRPDIRVPMREVELSPTRLPDETLEQNDPVRVYDTSGAWGDPEFHCDCTQGIPSIRGVWIQERGDVEEIKGRELLPSDDGYLSTKQRDSAQDKSSRTRLQLFDRKKQKVLRAKAGVKSVSQLHYARQGIITPEMEYIAIRENTKLQHTKEGTLVTNSTSVIASAE